MKLRLPPLKLHLPAVKLRLPRPKSWGWTAAGILLGLWVILQITGWVYGFQVHRLERKIQELRPTLSAIVLTEQLEALRKNCLQAFDEIRRVEIQGDQFLQHLSFGVPPSVTLEAVEFDPTLGLKIRGSFLSGKREPEAVAALLISRLQATGKTYRVRSLAPATEQLGLWRFELKAQQEG